MSRSFNELTGSNANTKIFTIRMGRENDPRTFLYLPNVRLASRLIAGKLPHRFTETQIALLVQISYPDESKHITINFKQEVSEDENDK